MKGYQEGDLAELASFYRAGLLDDTLPFWLPRALDSTHGGYLTMRERDGALLDDDKPVWFQGRFSWLLSTLYRTCLLYTSPSPRDRQKSRMPSSA